MFKAFVLVRLCVIFQLQALTKAVFYLIVNGWKLVWVCFGEVLPHFGPCCGNELGFCLFKITDTLRADAVGFTLTLQMIADQVVPVACRLSEQKTQNHREESDRHGYTDTRSLANELSNIKAAKTSKACQKTFVRSSSTATVGLPRVGAGPDRCLIAENTIHHEQVVTRTSKIPMRDELHFPKALLSLHELCLGLMTRNSLCCFKIVFSYFTGKSTRSGSLKTRHFVMWERLARSYRYWVFLESRNGSELPRETSSLHVAFALCSSYDQQNFTDKALNASAMSLNHIQSPSSVQTMENFRKALISRRTSAANWNIQRCVKRKFSWTKEKLKKYEKHALAC